MPNNIEILFWVALAGAMYSYFIYPLILIILPRHHYTGESMSNSDSYPRVSFIITAHNEQSRIADKIKNTLEIDYPPNQFEIIVASDASTDNTDNIVADYSAKNVKLVCAEERRGKEHAQLLAVRAAQGDILVFSDVATEVKPDVIKLLVDSFKTEKIGAVSSEDRFLSADGSMVGEGAYVKYEMWLRQLESSVNSLVGLSGSFFAVRKKLCETWDTQIPSDFNTAMNCVRQGYIAVSDPAVIGYYKDVKTGKGEYTRKYRTVLRGISAVFKKTDVLNPFKYGMFAFQVFSHKIMRWSVPWFLLIVMVTSIYLFKSSWLYQAALVAQVVFYGLVISGALVERLRSKVYIRIPYYFAEVNIAIAHATLAYLFGKRIVVWTPTKR